MVLSRLLRVGVWASACIVAVGLVYYLAARQSGYPHGDYPRSLAGEVAGLMVLRPYAVIAAGLLLLIATPIARVAVSVAFFVRRRDWQGAAVTATVLGILTVAFMLGARLP